MTPCIEEAHRLLRLAERDLHIFHILASHPDAALSAICFHAQQSSLPLPARELRRLNPYTADFRYGEEAIALMTREEAKDIAEKTLQWARQHVSEVEAS